MSFQPNWAVFISGTGSNLASMLELPFFCRVAWVVSSKASAPGLARAKRMGVPCSILPKEIDWGKVIDELNSRNIRYIFLAGFMKVIPRSFLDAWRGKIINIHPSLLPKYPGLRSIQRAYEDDSDLGVSIHEVIPEVDAGRILLQGNAGRARSLIEAEFKTHVLEQRLGRKVFEKWQLI